MLNNQRKKYAMIFLGPFPKGNVSTLRIISYCKELSDLGHEVCVYLLAPTKEAEVNLEKKGRFQGISFVYLSKITWGNSKPSIVLKFFYYLYGILSTLVLLSKTRVDCILTYHFNPVSNLIFWIYAKISKIKFVLDKTEYPKNFFISSKIKRKFIQCNLQFFDKIITISNELKIFYGKIIGEENVFLLPMTIDSSRYEGITPYKNANSYIAVVFGTHNRDNILDSVRSYVKFLECNPNKKVELFLIGNFNILIKNYPYLSEIDEIIKDIPSVKKMGMVDNNLIPGILIGASCLLSTPTSYVSGGFPTKLGEYLLSGNPVVITSVGEIPNYLINNDTAYLCSAGDVLDIASKLQEVFENTQQAQNIGRRGRKLALDVFNAKTYVKGLINFLN